VVAQDHKKGGDECQKWHTSDEDERGKGQMSDVDGAIRHGP